MAEISIQPKDVFCAKGSSVDILLTVKLSSESESVSVAWKKSDDNGSNWGTISNSLSIIGPVVEKDGEYFQTFKLRVNFPLNGSDPSNNRIYKCIINSSLDSNTFKILNGHILLQEKLYGQEGQYLYFDQNGSPIGVDSTMGILPQIAMTIAEGYYVQLLKGNIRLRMFTYEQYVECFPIEYGTWSIQIYRSSDNVKVLEDSILVNEVKQYTYTYSV